MSISSIHVARQDLPEMHWERHPVVFGESKHQNVVAPLPYSFIAYLILFIIIAYLTNLSSNAIVLAVQQDKHGSDQLWILNDRLLSPTDHCVWNQLL